MWLLDVNLPTAVQELLRSFGIDCDTTSRPGLASSDKRHARREAYRAGFRVILTRDRGFGESAASAWASCPDLAVVIVTLPQARGTAYVAEFKSRWTAQRIEPQAGRVITWP